MENNKYYYGIEHQQEDYANSIDITLTPHNFYQLVILNCENEYAMQVTASAHQANGTQIADRVSVTGIQHEFISEYYIELDDYLIQIVDVNKRYKTSSFKQALSSENRTIVIWLQNYYVNVTLTVEDSTSPVTDAQLLVNSAGGSYQVAGGRYRVVNRDGLFPLTLEVVADPNYEGALVSVPEYVPIVAVAVRAQPFYSILLSDYGGDAVSDVSVSVLAGPGPAYVARNLTPSGGRVSNAFSAFYAGDFRLELVGAGWRTDGFAQRVDDAARAVALTLQRAHVALSFVCGGAPQADVAFHANGRALRCDALECLVPNGRGTFPLTVAVRKGRYQAAQATFAEYGDAFELRLTRLYGGLRPWAWWTIAGVAVLAILGAVAFIALLRRRRGKFSAARAARRDDALRLPVEQRYE